MRFARDYQLETERCVLRHVSEEDIPHIISATRVAGFNDGMSWEPPANRSELLAPLERNFDAWSDDSAYNFSIESRDGEFLGRIQIRSTELDGLWNLGFWTHPKFQRLGYMPEAVERIWHSAF